MWYFTIPILGWHPLRRLTEVIPITRNFFGLLHNFQQKVFCAYSESDGLNVNEDKSNLSAVWSRSLSLSETFARLSRELIKEALGETFPGLSWSKCYSHDHYLIIIMMSSMSFPIRWRIKLPPWIILKTRNRIPRFLKHRLVQLLSLIFIAMFNVN